MTQFLYFFHFCENYLLTFGRPALGCARPNFTIIPPRRNFVKTFFKKTFLNYFPKTLDFWGSLCYYNNVKREVPKDAKMGDEVHRVKKVRKKKNFLLTNQIKYDILDNVKRERKLWRECSARQEKQY